MLVVMDVYDTTQQALDTAAAVRVQRTDLDSASPAAQLALVDDLFEQLTHAMRPLRSLRGRAAWTEGDEPSWLPQVREASAALQAERKALRRKRTRLLEKQDTQAYRGRRARYRERNYTIVAERKRLPCVDCGGTFDPVAMDFDHVRGAKKSSIASMCNQGVGVAQLEAELAKCDLVCANCHRVRTHRR